MRSMTGFAAIDGAGDGYDGAPIWRWEARSVNGRGLELRLRAPAGFEAEEADWRARAGRKLQRGVVGLTLSLLDTPAAGAPRLDPAALDAAVAACRAAADRLQAAGLAVAPTAPSSLLALPGVLAVARTDGKGPDDALRAAVTAGLQATLEALDAARRAEGARLAAILSERLDEIERLVAQAEQRVAARADAAPDRLRERLAAVLGAGAEVEPQRLAQELALLAVKADVREELDRLRAHLASARAMIGSGEAVGRKLEFLAQELHREANTLCAKSQDAALTDTGLALKVCIDHVREQAANVE